MPIAKSRAPVRRLRSFAEGEAKAAGSSQKARLDATFARRCTMRRADGLSNLGLLLIIGMLCILVLLIAFEARRAWSRMQDSLASTNCARNLKQLGLALKMYAYENTGLYPPIHGFDVLNADRDPELCAHVEQEFDFIFDMRAMYPEYIPDLYVLQCPHYEWPEDKKRDWPHWYFEALGTTETSRPGVWCGPNGKVFTNADISYTYLGWQFVRGTAPNDDDVIRVAALASYLRSARLDPSVDLNSDILVDALDEDIAEAVGVDALLIEPIGFQRLRENAEPGRAAMGSATGDARQGGMSTDPSHVPVVWDRVELDARGRATSSHGNEIYVVFQDGHAERLRIQDRFPASRTWAKLWPMIVSDVGNQVP